MLVLPVGILENAKSFVTTVEPSACRTYDLNTLIQSVSPTYQPYITGAITVRNQVEQYHDEQHCQDEHQF